MKNFRTNHVFIKETEGMHALNIMLNQGFNMVLCNIFSTLDNLLFEKVIQDTVLYTFFF